MLAHAPIFLCGTSRSGTTVIQSALDKVSGLSLTPETHYFDDLRPKLDQHATEELSQRNYRLAEDYFLALSHRPYGHGGVPGEGWLAHGDLMGQLAGRNLSADNLFVAYNELLALRRGATRWGEKTPRHVFRIAEILGAFPRARVIVMQRDPRAVVASYRDWDQTGYGDDPRLDPNAEDLESQRAKESYHPATLAFLWKGAQVAAVRAREEFGEGRVYLCKYEDVVHQPELSLGALLDWLGVDPPEDLLDVPTENSSYDAFQGSGGFRKEAAERWRTRLRPAEVRVIEQAIGSWLSRCGYSAARSGGYLGALGLWTTFPWAVLRAARLNAGRAGGLPQYLLRRARLAIAGS